MTGLLVAATGRQHDAGFLVTPWAVAAEAGWLPDGVRHAYLPGDDLTLCGLNVPWLHRFPAAVEFAAEPAAAQCPGCRLLATSLGHLPGPPPG